MVLCLGFVEGNSFRDNGVLGCTPDLRDATCDPDFVFFCGFGLHGLVPVWAQVSPAPPPPGVDVRD